MAHLIAHGGQVLLGGRQAVLDGLEHRLERGEGGAQVVARVRDQLAAASKRRSSSSAIRLKDAPRSASSAGPDSGARAVRSPPASSSLARRTRETGPVTERATSSAPTSAAVADAQAAARTVRSCPESNISTPDATTAASGRTMAISARAITRPRRLRSARPQREADSRDQRDRRDGDGRADHGANR